MVSGTGGSKVTQMLQKIIQPWLCELAINISLF